MTATQIYDTIEKAIKNKNVLILTVKHGLGDTIPDTSFEAYILGDDTYQYSFTWGYLPDQKLYYKFMLSNIVLAKASTKKYDVREDACYQHSIEEEHYRSLAGFENIYIQAARTANI